MTVLAALMEQIERSVQPDVRASRAVRQHYAVFLATRLGLSLVAIGTLLAGFVAGHLPAAWEAITLTWLSIPLGVAVLVTKTQRLVAAQIVCLVAWLGFAAVGWAHGGLTASGAIAILLVVVLEGVTSFDATVMRVGAIGALGGLAGLVLGTALDLSAPVRGGDHAQLWLLVPVLLYAVALACCGTAVEGQRLRRALSDLRREQGLAEATGDLVLRCDRGGLVRAASRAAEPLFGLSPHALLGRGFFEHVHVADRPACLKTISDAATSGTAGSVRLRVRLGARDEASALRAMPRFVTVELRAIRSAEVLEDNGPAMMVLVRDISAQIEHEEAIRKARDEAEQAALWKGAFIASVSHELRTPLNAIIGFSEILANKDLSPRDPAKQQDYAGIIMESGQHLLSVVNSLLDISKIEAGRFELDPESFDLSALIEGCCDMVSLKAEQAGIAILRDPASMADAVVADKRACKQIVLNLLSNALKFTSRGGHVTIGARAQGQAVLLTVSDTGVGIAAADIDRVGDAFFQARSGYDRAQEGTGLGLSVVRGLVGLHGGSITLDSAVGEGTRIVVRLPLDCRNASAVPTAAITVIPRPRQPLAFVGANEQTRMQKRA